MDAVYDQDIYCTKIFAAETEILVNFPGEDLAEVTHIKNCANGCSYKYYQKYLHRTAEPCFIVLHFCAVYQ